MTTFVINATDFSGFAYSILIDGKSPYTGRTIAEMQKIEKNLIEISEEEFMRKEQEYENSLCAEWKEITEERYNEMLNVLPPMKWRDVALGINVFAISEAYTGNLHAHFVKVSHGKEYRYLEALRPINSQDAELAVQIIDAQN